ncbi:TPA: hypothetical protein HA239_04530 [Candidatus Woesearchaeota archaeon]|nr:hypothetical protein QT06_C0001G0129 [archaeon GW2011_AR15]MBS3104066.1 hypothetical protein [Candidatus Woesearchaeota archaeon]HIH41656.1 hypothetical protein [Candidatus Woesearchaeota archaeon]
MVFFIQQNIEAILLYVGLFSLQISFLITSILGWKVYKNKTKLVHKKKLNHDVAEDNFLLVFYILTILLPIFFTYVIFSQNTYLGFINVFILFIYSVGVHRLSISEFEKIIYSRRLINPKFKKNIYNLIFRPYIYFGIAFFCLIINLIIR